MCSTNQCLFAVGLRLLSYHRSHVYTGLCISNYGVIAVITERRHDTHICLCVYLSICHRSVVAKLLVARLPQISISTS